jgi:hypothetical protein
MTFMNKIMASWKIMTLMNQIMTMQHSIEMHIMPDPLFLLISYYNTLTSSYFWHPISFIFLRYFLILPFI